MKNRTDGKYWKIDSWPKIRILRVVMSQKRPKQPSISGFFTKIPKISPNIENLSSSEQESEPKSEVKTEENFQDFSQNETKN